MTAILQRKGCRSVAGYDWTGSYTAPLGGLFLSILVAIGLMTRLGPYRFRPSELERALSTNRENCMQELRNLSEAVIERRQSKV